MHSHFSKLRSFRFSFIAIAAALLSMSALAEETPLCVGNVCLAMTVDELARIDLVGIRDIQRNKSLGFTGAVRFSPNEEDVAINYGGYGLDANKKKIHFTYGYLDKNSLINFSEIKTICKMSSFSTVMRSVTKASDGLPIFIDLSPVIENDRSFLKVTYIRRIFPENLSDPVLLDLVNDIKKRYGAASAWRGEKKPYATIGNSEFSFGGPPRKQLVLSSNVIDLDIGKRLMEQHGCSSKPRLD